MFSGEESVRIRSNLPREELEDAVADSLDRLGDVKFTRGNEFRVRTKRFDSSMSVVTIDGELRKGRKEGEWTLTLFYNVKPTPLCWVIAILGFIFLVIGVLILLIPYNTQNEVKRKLVRAIRDARDDVEDRGEEKGSGA
jgi:hypothetical protein